MQKVIGVPELELHQVLHFHLKDIFVTFIDIRVPSRRISINDDHNPFATSTSVAGIPVFVLQDLSVIEKLIVLLCVLLQLNLMMKSRQYSENAKNSYHAAMNDAFHDNCCPHSRHVGGLDASRSSRKFLLAQL